MVMARESAADVLVEYLTTTSTPPETIAALAEQAYITLADAQALAIEFADLYPGFLMLDAYYHGRPRLPQEPADITISYRDLLRMSVSNWCAPVVVTTAERLEIAPITSSQHARRDPVAWG